MKSKGCVKDAVSCIASDIVISYAGMSAVWILTGMKYKVFTCLKIQLILFVLSAVLRTVYSLFCVGRDTRRIEAISRHIEIFGYDDECLGMIRGYLGENENNDWKMQYASFCIDGKRYSEGERVLGTVDFSALDAQEREEYFNALLYLALLEENTELANDIYRKAKHYFDRAVMNGRGGNILHTLGLLCLKNGNPQNARNLFFAAMKGAGQSLMCECELGLGFCALAEGDAAEAKEQCYIAAELVVSRRQAEGLRELMLSVERAYKNAHM